MRTGAIAREPRLVFADVLVGLRALFSSGWAFFLPYAFFYALGFGLAWTNATVRSLFWMCHLALVAAFVVFAVAALRARYGAFLRVVRDPGSWFWVLLCLGFVLPGAYLEFPADPWEHLRRLNAWDPAGTLRQSPWILKSVYFWGWTFFSLVPPIHRRLVADLYSGFWQILLAYQFYRLGFRLSGSRAWARLHVIGAVALFGNNVFGFFRYYALSSTMLAYIAYLAAAITVLDLLEGRTSARRAVPTLLATVGLMVFNHVQEFLLLMLWSSAAVFAVTWAGLSRRRRVALAGLLSVGFVISFLVARRVMVDPAAFSLTPSHFCPPYFSAGGVFRIWDRGLNYFHTMGLHGMVAVLLGIILWRSHRLIAALTLTPVIMLIFPPFAIPLAQLTPRIESTYRVLFVLPTSVILITAFQASARLIGSPSERMERLLQWGALAVVLVLGLHESAPFFGKLAFQYHRPPGWLQARYLDVTAQWLYERRPGRSCVPTSDGVTETVLVDFFGAPIHVDRLSGAFYPGYSWSARNLFELLDQAGAYSHCGFLLLDTSPDPWRRERSHYGPLSGHWAPYGADPFTRMPPGFREMVPLLTAWGWKRTIVPPFYWYYEPPARGASPR